LLSPVFADLASISLADEMVLKPAPITTSRDRVKLDLASRLACLDFIGTAPSTQQALGDSNTCSIDN